MVSRFERSGKANYLVLCTEKREEKMADRMLLQNEIKGLLLVRIERINGCKEYYYDISSKHSLGSIVKKGSLDVPKIRLLIETIGEILKQFHEYMLEPDGLCLSEELIYTALPEWNLQFCYYEEDGKNFSEKLRKLLQFVIEYVDYQDKEAVALAYACYQAAMQENFTFEKIEECLLKGKREKEENRTAKIKQAEIVDEKDNKKEERLPETNRRQNFGVRLATEPRIQSEVMEEEAEESSFDTDKAKRISCYIVGGGCLLTGVLWLVASEGMLDTFGILSKISPVYMVAFGVGLTLIVFIFWSVIKRRWKEKTKLVTKEVVYPFEQNKQESSIENNMQVQKGKNQQKNQQKQQDFYKEQEIDKNAELYNCERNKNYFEEEIPKKEQDTEYGKTVLLSYRTEEYRILFSCQKEYPSIEITEYPCSIGKIPSLNQIVIAHEGISRIHCSIQKEADYYTITDRNSTNGVILNGRRLLPNETVELPIESEIVLGILHYIFR